MKRKIVFWIYLCSIVGLFAVNLDEMIQYGLNNSLSLRQKEEKLKNAELSYHSSVVDLYPDLTANLKLVEDIKNSQESNNLSINLSKSISLNDPQYNRFDLAKFDYQTARIAYEDARRKFIYNILTAYINVLNLQKQIDLLEKNKEIQQSIVKQSKVLFNQQKATSFDVRQSEITLLNADISLLKAKNDLSIKRNELFNSAFMQDDNKKLEDIYSEYSLIPEMNVQKINDYILAQRELDRNHILTRQSKLNLFPTLNLQYSFSKLKGNNNLGFDYQTDLQDHTIMLNLSYNFKNFIINNNTYTQSLNNVRSQEYALRDLEKNLTTQYSQLISDMDYLQKLNLLYKEKIKQTEENLSIASQRYELGMIQQLDYDKSRYEYLDAKLALEANQYDLLAKKENINYLLCNKLLNKY